MDELLRLYPSPMQMKERLRVIDIATMAYPGRVDVAKLGRFMQILQRAIKSGDLASAGTARGVGQHSFAHTLVAREAFAAFLVKQNIKPEGQLEGWVNPDANEHDAPTMPDKAPPGRKPDPATTLAFKLRPDASSDRDAATKAVNTLHPAMHEDLRASKIDSIERAFRRKRKESK